MGLFPERIRAAWSPGSPLGLPLTVGAFALTPAIIFLIVSSHPLVLDCSTPYEALRGEEREECFSRTQNVRDRLEGHNPPLKGENHTFFHPPNVEDLVTSAQIAVIAWFTLVAVVLSARLLQPTSGGGQARADGQTRSAGWSDRTQADTAEPTDPATLEGLAVEPDEALRRAKEAPWLLRRWYYVGAVVAGYLIWEWNGPMPPGVAVAIGFAACWTIDVLLFRRLRQSA